MGNDAMVVQTRGNYDRGCSIIYALCLVTLVLGVTARILHLTGTHYYLLGTDSYYFADLARDADTGIQGSGLVYLIAYLPGATYWLPIMIGVIGAAMCYWIAATLYNRTTGLFAAAVWALIPQSIYITAVGNIDRDGYCIILLALAMMLWWKYRDRWIWVPLVLGVIELTVFSWAWIARPLFMLPVLAATVMLWQRANIRKVAVFVMANIGLWVLQGPILKQSDKLTELADPTGQGIAELSGITAHAWMLHYGFIAVLVGIGVYIALNRRREADLMLLAWFTVYAVLGIMAQRVLVFALPVAVVLSAIVLEVMYKGLNELSATDTPKRRLSAILVACTIAVIGMCLYQSTQLGNYRGVSASLAMTEVLKDIRLDTPDDTVVLAHWDYNKMIMYLADRDTVGIHNEYWTHDIEYACDHIDAVPDLLIDTGADCLICDTDEGVEVYGCHRETQ